MDKSKIEMEAKQILDKFARALSRVDEKAEIGVDRDAFEREEMKTGVKSDSEFKKKILENASDWDDDFIIAERGNWK